MEIQLKKMTIDHVPDVRWLSEQLGYPIPTTQIEMNINELVTSPNHIAFVAIYNQQIVGWIHAFRAMLIESKPFIEIGGLVVDENFRNSGIGKKLVNKTKEWAIQKAINEVRVRSNVLRNEAHRFYLNNGFIEIKQQKVFQLHL
jgi:GNAT superfamily N-acetyltransferase